MPGDSWERKSQKSTSLSLQKSTFLSFIPTSSGSPCLPKPFPSTHCQNPRGKLPDFHLDNSMEKPPRSLPKSFFGAENTGTKFSLGMGNSWNSSPGKSLGLSHPVAVDLGIFDSRCSSFSWKIPHEGKNGGAGAGHGGLGGFYPKFPGIEGWVTPKLSPGVFSRTKEDPGWNLGVPDGNQALPAKPQLTKSRNLCNSWIFPPCLQSFGKSPGSRNSWNQIPIYSGLVLTQIHRHRMIRSRTFPFGCPTPKFCSSHQFFHGKMQHSQHSAFPAFPHSLAMDWSIPLDGSQPWMRRVEIFGKLGIVSQRFNSSDASLEKKTKPGFLKFPLFHPFPMGILTPLAPEGEGKLGITRNVGSGICFPKAKLPWQTPDSAGKSRERLLARQAAPRTSEQTGKRRESRDANPAVSGSLRFLPAFNSL
ncbi:uncharacterized protein LOC111938509 [Cyanistes caeruleus]|uniref:uncharacterized protein LOC111938509 n=1 Tax=Cyanistes caeruleus TaxID=156563 RepID=UPI000CDA5F85|nr:uncharacterized protein LOC111938509 [Cyanistes caeruleus]